MVQVVIFEGWCVGFRALTEERLERKWREAVAALEGDAEGWCWREMDGQLSRVRIILLRDRSHPSTTGQRIARRYARTTQPDDHTKAG